MNTYEECCFIACGDCVHFQVDADRREDTTCKRLDHKKYKVAVPWFKSYDCSQHHCNICSEFEPKDRCVWLKEHWKGIEQYLKDYEAAEGKSFFDGKYTVLTINGDTSVNYYVRRRDYFYGDFINPDGSLKWVKRCYYKQSRKSPTGYKLIWEFNEEETSK